MKAEYEGPSCGFAFYGPPAICTCGQCPTCELCDGAGEIGPAKTPEGDYIEQPCPRCVGTGLKK